MTKRTSPMGESRPAAFRDPRLLAGAAADTPLCIALSGGADSVALLCLLAGDPHLSAVHVHHGIRGAEADRDADFCRTVTEKYGVPLTVLHIDAPALARERRISLETAAREGRYAAITAYMKERHIPLLVTAHHADDQLETLLQHLLRGSGRKGLCGIPACRPLGDGLLLVRPLLQMTRKELRALLSEMGQDYVEDSTNGEPCCTRNRLRLEVAPVLEALYPGGAAAAARCAESLQEDEAFLLAQAQDFLAEQGPEPALAALAALPRPIFVRVMQQLLPKPPERVHIEDLTLFCQKATPHAVLSLPGVQVTACGGRLCFLKDDGLPADYEVILKEGENPLPCGALAVVIPTGSTVTPPAQGNHRYCVQIPLCRARIRGPLRARPQRPGDTLRSGGVNRAVRRLPGPAVSIATRRQMPLLCDDGGVLACPFGKNHNIRDDAYAAKDCDLQVFLLFS